MKKGSHVVFSMSVVGFLILTTPVQGAQKIYELNGTVEKITPETIVIQKGGQLYEFNRNQENVDVFNKSKDKVKIGDYITVVYYLDAKNVVFDKERKRQAGQVNLKDRNIIIDDRAFYPAKREKSEKNSDKG